MKELFILGSGVMARALAWGLKDDYALCIVGRSAQKLDEFQKDGTRRHSHHSSIARWRTRRL